MRRSESFSTAPYENGYRFLLTNVFPSHQPVKKREFSAQTYGSSKFHSYFQQASPPLASSNENMLQGKKRRECGRKREEEGGGEEKVGREGGGE